MRDYFIINYRFLARLQFRDVKEKETYMFAPTRQPKYS